VGDAWVVLPFAAACLAADVWVVLFFGGVHSVLPHKSILRQIQDGNDDAEKLSAAE
jgi:heme exporter protein D